MSTTQMALEYLLVYCTSHGLTAIGEPPLAKTYQPVGESLLQTSRNYNKNYSDPGSKDAMPVWIMFGFLSLATAKYLLSFTVSFGRILSKMRRVMWYLGLVCLPGHFNRYHRRIYANQDCCSSERSQAPRLPSRPHRHPGQSDAGREGFQGYESRSAETGLCRRGSSRSQKKRYNETKPKRTRAWENRCRKSLVSLNASGLLSGIQRVSHDGYPTMVPWCCHRLLFVRSA